MWVELYVRGVVCEMSRMCVELYVCGISDASSRFSNAPRVFIHNILFYFTHDLGNHMFPLLLMLTEPSPEDRLGMSQYNAPPLFVALSNPFPLNGNM
jgi:hypothetical protein